MKIAPLFVNDKKIKLKKHANEFVDIENEKKNDPKYKTELCKSFTETNFCVYGNKCRFAHGRGELFGKPIDQTKYKVKECNSFKDNGYCMYGSRCNFKHYEVRMENIDRSYYYYKMLTESELFYRKNYPIGKRLSVFERYAEPKTAENSPLLNNTKISLKQPCFSLISSSYYDYCR
jgi:hypothetical protein